MTNLFKENIRNSVSKKISHFRFVDGPIMSAIPELYNNRLNPESGKPKIYWKEISLMYVFID